MKVIIIGGVAGGATAAARLRRLDESAEIIIPIYLTGHNIMTMPNAINISDVMIQDRFIFPSS